MKVNNDTQHYGMVDVILIVENIFTLLSERNISFKYTLYY